MKTFEILFVRHALSCANVWKKKGILKAHLRYHDPEITTEGIRRSIEIGNTIQYPFKTAQQEPFTIGASVMLRAQQTAYLMFAKRMNKPIFVIPYIGEVYPTLDNLPAPIEVQHERYSSNKVYTESPSLEELVYKRGLNFRKQEDSWSKMVPVSSFSTFLEWIQEPENESFFAKGSDGIFRAIFVTHAGFMEKHFKIKGIKKINNNDGILVRIQTGEGKPVVRPFGYLPAGESDIDYDVCPDNACRYPPPCKTRGGKRNGRRKRYTRKQR